MSILCRGTIVHEQRRAKARHSGGTDSCRVKFSAALNQYASQAELSA